MTPGATQTRPLLSGYVCSSQLLVLLSAQRLIAEVLSIPAQSFGHAVNRMPSGAWDRVCRRREVEVSAFVTTSLCIRCW